MIVGNIDGVFHNQVTGWVLQDNKSCADELILIINDQEIDSEYQCYERPDVGNIYGGDKNCGFKFDVKYLDEHKIHSVKLKHKTDEFNFNAVEIYFCPAVSNKYNEIKNIFYPEYYRVKYNKVGLSNENAWEHYFNHGIYNDLDPSPWFNNSFFKEKYSELLNDEVPLIIQYLDEERKSQLQASEVFCPAYYSSRYSDLNEFDGLLAHYTAEGHVEGRIAIKRQVPQHLVEELNEISNLEPSIAAASRFLSEIIRYPQLPSSAYLPDIVKQKFNEIEVVIVIPFISIGGADLLSTYLLKAYQEKYSKSKILLIVTDKSQMECKDWLETDSNVLVFDDEVKFNSHSERVHALHECIGVLSPSVIFNINSSVCWELYRQYGKQLSTVANLYAMLFCFDYDHHNNRVGYITSYLRECIRYLRGVMFDNKKIIEDIKNLYGLLESDLNKLHCIYTPAPNDTISLKKNSSSYCILWQGRLCNQKRPDLLVRLANANPHLNFLVYGTKGNSPHSDAIINKRIPNIDYRGTYSSLSEIPFENVSLYLNTSQWDGVPTIMLQMLSVGLPVVSTNVGGISEVVDGNSSILITDVDDIEEYQLAVNFIFNNHSDYLENAKIYSTEIKAKLSWENYMSQLENAGIFQINNILNSAGDTVVSTNKAA